MMLRSIMLCCFLFVGVALSAQTTAAKTSCTPAQCQAKKMAATTSCQAKATTVAVATTPAPERAANTTVEPLPLFKLTSATSTKANCQPADCVRVCEPKNCDPSACQPSNCKPGTSTSATTTALALKQE